MRGELLPERTQDHIQHRISPQQHVIVPEPQHSIPGSLKLACAPQIVSGLLHMLTTIEFNDQPALEAAEIDDKPFNTMLPTKPITKLTATKAIPEPDLRVGGVLAKRFDMIHESPRQTSMPQGFYVLTTGESITSQ